MALQIRRGTEAQRIGITLAEGELVYTTDSKKLYIGDGHTLGGYNVLQTTFTGQGTGLVWNTQTSTVSFESTAFNAITTTQISEGSNKYYTPARAVSDIYNALVNGSPSNIGFGYNPGTNTITATVTGGGTTLPPTLGNNGKYLTIDNGGNIVWATAPVTGLSIPNPVGHQGAYLTTDGVNLVWANIAINSLTSGTYYATLSNTTGAFTLPGSLQLPQTGDITRYNGSTYVSVLNGILYSIQQDTSPKLGASLDLNSHSITGTGVTISGANGSISANNLVLTSGLGADLNLNGHSLVGTGNINITGGITSSGNITGPIFTTSLSAALGNNFSLNGYTITGTGSININGNITGSNLHSNLDITAPGNISGATLTASGNVTGNNVNAVSVISAPTLSATTNLITSSIQTPTEQFNLNLYTNTTGSVAKTVTINAARGTPSSPVSVSPGDTIGGITVNSYVGSGTYALSAGLVVGLDATADITKQNIASNLYFILGNNSNSFGNPQATLDFTGNFTAATLITGSYNGPSSYPTHGVTAGMIIFDSSTHHFFGYNGTIWKQLDN